MPKGGGSRERPGVSCGTVDSQQRAIYERCEHDLRMALKSLLESSVDDIAHVREARELIQEAHDLVEFVLLGRAADPNRGNIGKTA
jgi:hypothetical protein